MRSMVDLQSAPSKNWSVTENKPPNPTIGKKASQSMVSNKMNCTIRLTARALVKGAEFIKIRRNRWHLKKKKKATSRQNKFSIMRYHFLLRLLWYLPSYDSWITYFSALLLKVLNT